MENHQEEASRASRDDVELVRWFVEWVNRQRLTRAEAAARAKIGASTVSRFAEQLEAGTLPPLRPSMRRRLGELREAEEPQGAATGTSGEAFIEGVRFATDQIVRAANRIRQARGMAPYPIPLDARRPPGRGEKREPNRGA